MCPRYNSQIRSKAHSLPEEAGRSLFPPNDIGAGRPALMQQNCRTSYPGSVREFSASRGPNQGKRRENPPRPQVRERLRAEIDHEQKRDDKLRVWHVFMPSAVDWVKALRTGS
jgi:hypothetical protein